MTTYSQRDLKKLSKAKVEKVDAFFYQYCCHTAGNKWRGVPFNLISWQKDANKKIFGTLKPDGMRQYRTVYIEIPKKNGKTEYAAGLALYGLVADGEYGAEVYCAAGDREQAGLVYKAANSMVEQRGLKKHLKPIISRKRLVYRKTNSFLQVLSNEVYTKHGLNPSLIVFDELHSQPNRDLYDVLVEGTDRARDQQLIIILTTAGIYDKESIGWEIHDYACQVRDGIIEDPSFLPIIYSINEEKNENGEPKESPDDPKVWKRVNPALGEIFEFDKLKSHYTQSKANPKRWNNFLRFTLNKWVGQIDRFIPMEHWDLCAKKVEKRSLIGKPCYGGLDLSNKQDLTAFVLVFPPVTDNDEKYKVLAHLYVPKDNIIERSRTDKVPYDVWADQGYITATPGNTIDFKFISNDIGEAKKLYDIREIAFDRWGSTQIVTEITEEIGVEMLQHGQGFASMSAPTKQLLDVVLAHDICHGGHPVLRWNIDNLAVKQDASENYKPDKKLSRERIDGAVALIMALGRCLADPNIRSVYEDRGIMFI